MQLWQKKRNLLSIEEMTRKDIPQVCAIDRLTYPSPAGEQYFETCLRQCAYGTCRPWVAYRNEELIGYMIWRQGGEAGEILELQRLAIHPDWQNKGFGKQMYLFFLDELKNLWYTTAKWLVPEELLASEQNRRSLEWVKRLEFANAQPPARLEGRNICFCRLIS